MSTDPRGSADSHAARYRSDIDGLRAIAVAAITLFHFHRTWLPDGYLGVDIFFVLSGFLITTILAREIGEARFSLLRFYDRRIRRIAPALLVMAAATMAVGTIVLLPVDLAGFARSVLATLVFASNVYFWRDTDYFARAAEEKPLLHTWSLAIEEQFYLFFPLILWLAFRFGARSPRWIVLMLTVLSLGLYLAALQFGAPIPAFYLLPTRAWELGAGATLALFRPGALRRPARVLLSVAGLAAISVSLFASVVLPQIPSVPEVLAVGGTTLMLWVGRPETGETMLPTSRLLTVRPALWLGRVSYSFYLWHWPIIVLVRYVLVRDLNVGELVAVTVLLCLVAALSYHFVEQPARQATVSSWSVMIGSSVGAAALAIGAVTLVSLDGLPGRMDSRAARANAVVNTMYRCPLANYVLFGASRGCVMNLPSRRPADAQVLLIGNSHALMYEPVVEELLVKRGLRGLLVPAVGCLPMTAVNVGKDCRRTAQENLTAIEELPAPTVMIAFDWPLDKRLYRSNGSPVAEADGIPAMISGIDETIGRLRARGKTVILVGPIAVPGWDVASIVSRALAFGQPVSYPTRIARERFMQVYGPVFDRFGDRNNVILARPDLIQCDQSHCPFVRGGLPIFADSSHLAVSALPPFATTFASALDEAARRSAGRVPAADPRHSGDEPRTTTDLSGT